eukprot:SAG31_NODE_11489_length_1024_cov_25.750270_2_plen_92_part_00
MLLEEIGLTLSDEELSELVNAMDSDGDGSVDVGEFAKHIRQAKKDAREAAADAQRKGPGPAAAQIRTVSTQKKPPRQTAPELQTTTSARAR